MKDEPLMTLDKAQRIIRDPSASLPAHMVAAMVLVESDSTLYDLLACAQHSHRSIAWQGAFALHQRTGRPESHDERGFLIIDTDGWERYLRSHDHTA